MHHNIVAQHLHSLSQHTAVTNTYAIFIYSEVVKPSSIY